MNVERRLLRSRLRFKPFPCTGRSLAIGASLALACLLQPHASDGAITLPSAGSLEPNLKIWYRADTLTAGNAAGDAVSTWADDSPNGADASTVTTIGNAADPTFALDDTPVVRFGAQAHDLMRAADVLGDDDIQDGTLIAVYNTVDTTASGRPMGFGSHVVGYTSLANWNIAQDPSLRFDGTAIATGYDPGVPFPTGRLMFRTTTKGGAGHQTFNEYFDGQHALVDAVPSPSLVGTTDEFYMGDLHGSYAQADIDVAEVIFYDRVLTPAERRGVEGYVQAKYFSNAYYRFEEGTAGSPVPAAAGSVLDHTANANNGTAKTDNAGSLPSYSTDVFGDTVPLTTSPNDLSLDFERDNANFLEVAHDPSLSFGDSSFTLEAWVKLETLGAGTPGTRQYIFHKKGDGNLTDAHVEYGFYLDEGKTLRLIQGNGSTNSQVASPFKITDTDRWHYVSAAFDAENDLVRIMLDDQIFTAAHTFTPVANTEPLIIGGHYNSGGVFDSTFDGLIDEMRITGAFLAPSDLLLAVPEPSGLLLALLGLMGLAGCRRTLRASRDIG